MRRRVLLIAGLVLIAPVVLMLNEAFGHPPAFTPKLPEPSPLAGLWSGPGVTLRVEHDGAVFGVFGNQQVYRARIMANRTWVGRALHWRTDYIITGQVGQYRFSAPFNVRDTRMETSFFITKGKGKPGPAHVVLERRS